MLAYRLGAAGVAWPARFGKLGRASSENVGHLGIPAALATMNRFIQVVTTTETKEEAERIARVLVEGRLAACVQVDGPVSSVYRWKGSVEQAEEWRCTAKTRRSLFAEVARAIRREHTYEVPEIVASELVEGSPAYVKWLDEQL